MQKKLLQCTKNYVKQNPAAQSVRPAAAEYAFAASVRELSQRKKKAPIESVTEGLNENDEQDP